MLPPRLSSQFKSEWQGSSKIFENNKNQIGVQDNFSIIDLDDLTKK